MAEPLFLLDSNICIYVLEGVGPALRANIERRAAGSVVTSAICYAEVMKGISPADSMRSKRADQLFALLSVLPFDQGAALAYRAMPFRRNSFDRLIAAHAIALGLTLVTNNVTDFAEIPGLKVENWML